MEQYLSALAKNPLFENMDAACIPQVLSCLRAHKKQYRQGTFIRQAGDKADFIGIVLEGNVQVLQDDYNGKRTITSAITSGALFAEAFACSGVQELPVSILAVTDCVVLLLNIDRILNPCENACAFHQQLLRNLLKIVARKNVFLNRKLDIVSHKTTQEKIMAFLHEQAHLHHSSEFTIPYDRQALADYLGVERSAMSAEISKLRSAGIIEVHRSHFRLL